VIAALSTASVALADGDSSGKDIGSGEDWQSKDKDRGDTGEHLE
jgi:hypothetical protein